MECTQRDRMTDMVAGYHQPSKKRKAKVAIMKSILAHASNDNAEDIPWLQCREKASIYIVKKTHKTSIHLINMPLEYSKQQCRSSAKPKECVSLLQCRENADYDGEGNDPSDNNGDEREYI